MYEKYTTEAFVVGQRNIKESDKIFLLFTRDFGLVWAIATGIRKPLSKLKSFLEVGNKIDITLIKGKEFWRVVEAEQGIGGILKIKESKVSFFHILNITQRMVQGEEKNQSLWQSLNMCFESLQNIDKKNIHILECIILTRVLDALGYGRTEKDWGISLTSDLTEEMFEIAKNKKASIVRLINESLKQSQLNH